MASAASNYNKTLLEIQRLANSSAKAIQQMINASNKSQMTYNSAEAQKSREWQEKMSKSAHQMEVQDLKKAGLNPVLSVGGSGAQSYTTSSASTTNDSGSSAVGAMLSSELGAMSNMESARMSADAQLKASTQQAKATRFAAQQSAAAQKYAADQSYKLGQYKANLEYQANKERIEYGKWNTKNATAGTWAGILDKALRNFGIYKGLSSMQKKSFSSAFGSSAKKYIKAHRSEFFDSKGHITNAGYNNARGALQDTGFSVNRKSVSLYYQAAYHHNQNALNSLFKNYHIETQYRKASKGKVTFSPFRTSPGWR